jgi:AraC-like DNA-binding protein
MMNIKWTKNGQSYFSKLLASLSLIVVTVIIIVTTILDVRFEQITLSKTYLYSEDTLSQISFTADSLLENVKMAVGQIVLDPSAQDFMYSMSVPDMDVMTPLSTKVALWGGFPFLQSIYLYNGKLNQLYTNGVGSDDQGILSILKNFDPEHNLKPIPRKIELPGNRSYNVYTFIYYESTGAGMGSAIVLNVSDTWLRNSINLLNKQNNGSVVIVDAEGRMVSGTYEKNFLADASHEEYVRKVMQSQEEKGYFKATVEGEPSLVTFTASSTLGWKYIRYTPYANISAELNHLHWVTIEVCALILFVGLLLSYFASKRLNLPVVNLLKQLESQKQVVMNNTFKMKQEFLQKLLLTENKISDATTRKRFQEYGISLIPQSGIKVMLFQIDQYEQFMAQYNYNDRELLRFGISNVVSEIFKPHFQCEVTDSQSDHIIVLFNTDHLAGYDEELFKEIQYAQKQIKEYLRLSTSVAVSGYGLTIANVHERYEEALDTSGYRLFFGWGTCIVPEMVEDRKNREYVYVMQTEEQISDCMMLGKLKEAQTLCTEFLDSAADYANKDFNMAVLRMFFAIHMTIDAMEKGTGYPFNIRMNDYYQQLAKQERLEDVQAVFLDLLSRVELKLGEKKNAKYDDLMQKIDTIIQTHYMKEDLGLEWIADSLHMSPIYLGRLIRKYMSKSITDYINETRIRKAAEFLVSSERTIADIAQQSGFSSASYFGKLFKKTHGVTPNEYRQKERI